MDHPTIVYDGKRMRPRTNRQTYDYAANTITSRFQANNLIPSINSYITPKLERVCVNKYKTPVNTICISPDGHRLISGTTSGEFTLWNTQTLSFETILQAHESPVRSLCWSPSGDFLLSSDSSIIKYWDTSMTNIQILKTDCECIRELSFGMNENKFVSGGDDGIVRIYDTKEARIENMLKGHGWDIRACVWHPTFALIASGGKDTSTRLWDPRGKEIETLHLHKNTINSMRWSLDGNFLFSAGKDQTIKMLDIRSFDVFSYRANKDVTAIAVHPSVDDLFVGVGNDLNFYKRFREEPLKIVERVHDGFVWGIEYHPMGDLLCTGSVDQSVRFWVRGEAEVKEEVEKEASEEEMIPGLF